jgi:hypothetical protein
MQYCYTVVVLHSVPLLNSNNATSSKIVGIVHATDHTALLLLLCVYMCTHCSLASNRSLQ